MALNIELGRSSCSPPVVAGFADGTNHALSPLRGTTFGISRNGYVAGVVEGRAIRWDDRNKPFDLGEGSAFLVNSDGVTAGTINERGRVLGSSWTEDSHQRAVIWR